MPGNNYKRTITVEASPEKAFLALTTGYEHWWTKPDKPFEKVNDVSKFEFTDKHGYWTFKAKELTPTQIRIECFEALHIQENLPKEVETEWLGTTLIWLIEEQGDKTVIHFEHIGLKPSLHCYDICEAGWDLFFVNSLKAYLDTGVGKPFNAG